MSCCKGLNFESILYITTECSELRELNLQNTRLCQNSTDILSAKLSNKMEKLNLRGLWTVQDRHIKELVTRCEKLSELELRYTRITDHSIDILIQYASKNLVKLAVDTYSNVEFRKLLELRYGY